MLYRWKTLSAPFEQLELGCLFEALPLFDNTLQFPLPTQYNVESQEKTVNRRFICGVGGGGKWECVVYKRATNENFSVDFCPRLYRSRSIDFRCFWNSAVELLL